MLTILSLILICSGLIGLLIAFPSIRRAIMKGLKILGCFIKKHSFATLLTIVAIIAIVMNDFVAKLLAPFGELAIIVLGICIILGSIWKKFSKYAWRIGTIATIIILITVALEKLPW